MKNLDLELLRTFAAIAKEQTFALASERVHRTPSAISQQMQRLETQLGRELLRKTGRTKTLTPHGFKLLGYATRMLALNDEVLASFASEDMQGSIRFGAPHDIAETLLPNLLSRFAQAYPELKMEIHVGRSPHLMEALARGDIDITLSTRLTSAYPGFVYRTSPTGWICAHDYDFDASQPVALVLADPPSLYRKIALRSLERVHAPWRISYQSPTVVGIKAAVSAGLGVTARSLDMLGPGLRVLSEADGLPRLSDVSLYLYLAMNSTRPAARRLFELLGGDADKYLTVDQHGAEIQIGND
jgi:DNA-binding transcriptional LysR family regulator